jgi:hypothetical protein
MRKMTPALALFALAAVAAFAAPAHAQPTRTWVSGVGVDSGTCPRQTPCHTFTYAHGQVAPGGEITVLDPGGYGPVVITKAVSIVSDSGSGEAVVTTFSGDGITVNAGASDVVILRGLVVDGLNSASNGVRFVTGAALHIQNSLIKNVRGTSGVGINFAPGGASDLYVTDTTVINNTGFNGTGILVKPTGSGLVRATFNRVTVEQNAAGMTIDGSSSTGTIRATVRDSVISTNAGTGLWANSPAGAATGVYFINSSSAENGTAGIYANGANAAVTLQGASIMGNNIGISSPGGGNIYSYKNNAINFNFGGDGAVLPGNVLPLN